MIGPLQKLAKRSATVTVFGLLFRRELGEGLLDLGKEEQRVISEAVGSPWCVQDEALSASFKRRQRVSIAGNG